MVSNFGRRAIDVAHRDHDSKNCRDDAKSRKCIAHDLQNLRRLAVLFMRSLQIHVHQVVEIVSRKIRVGNNEPQRVVKNVIA